MGKDLCGLGDLDGREMGEITLAKRAKGREERWESRKNWELIMDETAEFIVRYHDLDVGHLSLRDGKWHFEYTDAFRKNNRISPGRDGTKAQGHKGTKGGSATAQAFWENDYRQSLYLDSNRYVGRTRRLTLAKRERKLTTDYTDEHG